MAMEVVPCTESASQFSETLVLVMAVAPNRVGAPTPHELPPTHDESCWKWWMCSNMLLRKQSQSTIAHSRTSNSLTPALEGSQKAMQVSLSCFPSALQCESHKSCSHSLRPSNCLGSTIF